MNVSLILQHPFLQSQFKTFSVSTHCRVYLDLLKYLIESQRREDMSYFEETFDVVLPYRTMQ